MWFDVGCDMGMWRGCDEGCDEWMCGRAVPSKGSDQVMAGSDTET